MGFVMFHDDVERVAVFDSEEGFLRTLLIMETEERIFPFNC
jgi:hypothetical protein